MKKNYYTIIDVLLLDVNIPDFFDSLKKTLYKK